ncbi:hypothetical protein CB1_000370027 [Camelus ferus]|nr:hypothetical protein CB1_000370027 [Camelus ferus]
MGRPAVLRLGSEWRVQPAALGLKPKAARVPWVAFPRGLLDPEPKLALSSGWTFLLAAWEQKVPVPTGALSPAPGGSEGPKLEMLLDSGVFQLNGPVSPFSTPTFSGSRAEGSRAVLASPEVSLGPLAGHGVKEVSVLTTLERRFNLQSADVGVIASSFEIGNLALILFGPDPDLICRSRTATNMMYLLLIGAQVLLGIGATPVQPLGVSYIDDHVRRKDSSLYIG